MTVSAPSFAAQGASFGISALANLSVVFLPSCPASRSSSVSSFHGLAVVFSLADGCFPLLGFRQAAAAGAAMAIVHGVLDSSPDFLCMWGDTTSGAVEDFSIPLLCTTGRESERLFSLPNATVTWVYQPNLAYTSVFVAPGKEGIIFGVSVLAFGWFFLAGFALRQMIILLLWRRDAPEAVRAKQSAASFLCLSFLILASFCNGLSWAIGFNNLWLAVGSVPVQTISAIPQAAVTSSCIVIALYWLEALGGAGKNFAWIRICAYVVSVLALAAQIALGVLKGLWSIVTPIFGVFLVTPVTAVILICVIIVFIIASIKLASTISKFPAFEEPRRRLYRLMILSLCGMLILLIVYLVGFSGVGSSVGGFWGLRIVLDVGLLAISLPQVLAFKPPTAYSPTSKKISATKSRDRAGSSTSSKRNSHFNGDIGQTSSNGSGSGVDMSPAIGSSTGN